MSRIRQVFKLQIAIRVKREPLPSRGFRQRLISSKDYVERIGALNATIALMLSLCLVSTGCVQRRLIVRSQPEGALVTIDNQPVGHTPVPVPFVYYGTRQIQLEKEGYKTVKVKERIRPPWYEKVPLSFFSNNLAFREIRDERVLDFQLEPRSQVEENVLLDRANELRLNSQRGTLTTPNGLPFNQ